MRQLMSVSCVSGSATEDEKEEEEKGGWVQTGNKEPHKEMWGIRPKSAKEHS